MNKHLLKRLEQKEYVSGETLAKELNVSRTSIWKYIKSFEQKGYIFESKKNKGYRLIFRPDIPIAEEILPYIKTSIIGKKFYHFPSLPSTNSHAKELLKKDISEGCVIVTEEQMNGRGRKNRKWFSPKGGLWFSVILYPDIPPQKAMYVTMAASIAISIALKEICNINPEIKWPNDILLDGKKICGILTELDAEMDKINYSIIGIGLNVNNGIPSALNHSATSLKKFTGNEVSRVLLLRSILLHFDKIYQYIVCKDLDFIQKTWLSYANIIGKEICVHGEKETIKGRVSDIDENGCLFLSTNKGITHIVAGDIEYI
ncbi:MAG: biotin--[acetyl-CoA-carboxylase] ligase [Thermoplasmata archaeon]|nr:MAG: biotin--[acetyl-CoA-carboxylase] ligase [Thermoplasmata archaeon]